MTLACDFTYFYGYLNALDWSLVSYVTIHIGPFAEEDNRGYLYEYYVTKNGNGEYEYSLQNLNSTSSRTTELTISNIDVNMTESSYCIIYEPHPVIYNAYVIGVFYTDSCFPEDYHGDIVYTDLRNLISFSNTAPN